MTRLRVKRENWHSDFLQTLGEAGDIDAQRTAWAAGLPSDFPSPTELICQLFDDSGVDDLLAEGVLFTESIDARLRDVSAAADELDLNLPPDALWKSEKWQQFSRLASQALEEVRGVLEHE